MYDWPEVGNPNPKPKTEEAHVKAISAIAVVIFICACSHGTFAQAALPNPVLYLTGHEYVSTGGKSFVRYRYDVLNAPSYPKADKQKE